MKRDVLLEKRNSEGNQQGVGPGILSAGHLQGSSGQGGRHTEVPG